MKAEMKATGQLVLTPETGAEAYALMRWVKEAEQPPAEGRPRAVCIDLSLFPETLPSSGNNEAAWLEARP